jgi:SAM-dependent methyltransferase
MKESRTSAMLQTLLHRFSTKRAQSLTPWPQTATRGKIGDDLIADYLATGRRPWSRGYDAFKEAFLAQHLADPLLLQRVATDDPLPPGYGEFLDERVVEYPWLLSRLQERPARVLDAGSSLNHAYLLDHPRLRVRDLTLVTLAPESQCHWQRRISYVFADLRHLPFRDNFFDEVVSISTVEHVGKVNHLYTRDRRFHENDNTAFGAAVRELRRVCRPGGKAYITVPFGRHTDFGWYQQFDARLLDQLVDAFAPALMNATYFRYGDGGWQVSDRASCADCEGFDIHATKYKDPRSQRDYDPDFAAASRGIAALELWKGNA